MDYLIYSGLTTRSCVFKMFPMLRLQNSNLICVLMNQSLGLKGAGWEAEGPRSVPALPQHAPLRPFQEFLICARKDWTVVSEAFSSSEKLRLHSHMEIGCHFWLWETVWTIKGSFFRFLRLFIFLVSEPFIWSCSRNCFLVKWTRSCHKRGMDDWFDGMLTHLGCFVLLGNQILRPLGACVLFRH